MLTQLNITNIAVISHAEISFKRGFSVFTGETGAGKSLIIDSLNMALGERGSRDLIRFGEKKALVEAVFTLTDTEKSRLEAILGDFEGNELLISRELHEDGRNVCKINGMLSTVAGLKSAAPYLINIHGQHDGQKLLSQSSHITFVDSLAKNQAVLSEYKSVFEDLKKAKEELDNIKEKKSEKLKRLDILKFWIDEIDGAALAEGEDEELEQKRKIMRSGEKLRESTSSAYSALYGGEQTAYEALSAAASLVNNAAGLDNALSPISDAINDALFKVEDAAHSLSSYAEGLDFDPSELSAVEERLETIYKLKSKYGNTIPEILQYAENCRNEADEIEFSDKREKELEKSIETLSESLDKVAEKLTQSRKEASDKLSQNTCSALAELDMKNVIFDVKHETGEYTLSGRDTIEFLVSTNPSQPPKPLQNIASGGEMSRICLAIKTVLSDADEVQTLIFDEIDAGVSGRAAQKIGEKMHELGREKQVISITHLPQIASQGDNHYLIEKSTNGSDVKTSVNLLDKDGRVDEIARMISGNEITENARSAALDMLNTKGMV
ncbi:MAG: DNA repair protein RecN [Clostridia bacterium]|nr:DNA repair protein RecN [Clostridia bacterium]